MENILGARSAGSSERAGARRRRLPRRALAGYAFVAPALVFLLVFALGPFLFTVYVSLHDWNMLTPAQTMPWRGLENYRYLLFDDPLFRETFRNTVAFAVANGMALSVLVSAGLTACYLAQQTPIAIRYAAAFDARYALLQSIRDTPPAPPVDMAPLPPSGWYHTAETSPDPNHWLNRCLADALRLKCRVRLAGERL